MLLAFAAAFGQRPEFEVASVKVSPPGGLVRIGGGPASSDPGQWTCVGCSLFSLLTHAYRLWEYQISGPEWLRATKFDVLAKIPPGTTDAQFRLMLQALLQERFKMTVHRENKVMPVFELTVAKSGLKMEEVQQPAPAPEPTKNVLDKDGFPIVPGGSGMRVFNGRGRIQFRAQTMDNIAHYLSTQAGRPVLDATGLKGKYALTLSWSQEGDPDPGPSIFQAIQDQLGLKLEPKKGTVEMLIVDRAEKVPVEN
jgi:uncharacterized protein (TIGR03435 family)